MRSNVLEFFVKIKDMASGGLSKFATNAQKAFSLAYASTQKLSGGNKSLAMSYNELQRKISALETNIKNSRSLAHIKAMKSELASLQRFQQKTFGSDSQSSKSGSGLLGSVIGGNLISSGIQKLVSVASGAVGDIWNDAMDSRRLSTAINATTRGQGVEAVAQTRALADKYGIDYKASLEGVKTLTGGLMNMNMPLAKQMQIFEGIAAGASAMKISSEDTKGALLALGQMASKGTVSAEELRGQLGERIPGAFGLAAKAMNVTESQLNKMLENGLIKSADFLPKFAAEMQKTFGNDALANASDPSAIVARYENAMFSLRSEIGNGLMPLVTPILEMFTRLATTVLPFINEGMRQLVGFFSGISISSGEWSSYMSVAYSMITNTWQTLENVFAVVWNIGRELFNWIGQSQLMLDIFWAVGKVFEGIGWVISKVADGISWLWSNILKPLLDGIEKVYRFVKEMLGFGGEKKIAVESSQTLTSTIANKVVTPTSATMQGAQSMLASGQKPSATSNKAANQVAAGVAGGGSRQITINVQKLVGIESQTVSGMSDAVANAGNATLEQLLRIINGGVAMANG